MHFAVHRRDPCGNWLRRALRREWAQYGTSGRLGAWAFGDGSENFEGRGKFGNDVKSSQRIVICGEGIWGRFGRVSFFAMMPGLFGLWRCYDEHLLSGMSAGYISGRTWFAK